MGNRKTKPRERGKPFSSRINPNDERAVARARQTRSLAIELRASVERGDYFISEFERFRKLFKTAPSTLNESASELEDLAGVSADYIEAVVKSKPAKARNLGYIIAILEAIIDTANERLLDVEGDHVHQWVLTPFTPSNAKDIQTSLEKIIGYLNVTNSLAESPELNDVWRQHLIRLCKTTIQMLESPEVETRKLAQCARELDKISRHPAIAPTIASVAGAVVGALAIAYLNPTPTLQSSATATANPTLICAPVVQVTQNALRTQR